MNMARIIAPCVIRFLHLILLLDNLEIAATTMRCIYRVGSLSAIQMYCNNSCESTLPSNSTLEILSCDTQLSHGGQLIPELHIDKEC